MQEKKYNENDIIDEYLLDSITKIEFKKNPNLSDLFKNKKTKTTDNPIEPKYSVPEGIQKITQEVAAISSALGENPPTKEDAKALLQAAQQIIGIVGKNL